MRVLVLGADGFVGRHLVTALGTTDWATPVAGSRRAGTSGDTARVLVDATDRDSLAQALAGVNAVVNCVAGDARTIADGAVALFAAAAGRRVVHMSSMAVYGGATGVINESHPLATAAGDYGDAKVAAERAAQDAGADAILLRPGCIYGPGSTQWSLRIARLLAERRIGDLGAGGDGCSNLVHVDDVVAATLAALRLPAGGVRAYNLAMPDAPDWNGYFLAFARALGTVPLRRIPGWQMKLETHALAIPLKLAEKAGRSFPPAIPPSLARLWAQDVTLDSRAATVDLGLAWTPLQSGVTAAADWCRPFLRSIA